jgi:hypothetical protein
MAKVSKEIQAIKSVMAVRSSLAILNYGLLAASTLRVTDLENDLSVFVGGEHGKGPVLVDLKLYVKTGNLAAAIQAAKGQDVKDFPSKQDTGTKSWAFNPCVLDGLLELAPACHTDLSRAQLCYIHLNKEHKEAVATNGHILFLKPLSGPVPRDALLSPKILKVAETLGGAAKFSIYRKQATEDAVPVDYVHLSGEGWELTSRVCDITYPSYHKVMPTYTMTGIFWNAERIELLQNFIKGHKEFIIKKSSLLHFCNDAIVVQNREINYLLSTEFKALLPIKPDEVLGLSAEYLQKCLTFLNGETVRVKTGTLIQAVTLTTNSRYAVIMPLRTHKDNNGISRKALLANEPSGF